MFLKFLKNPFLFSSVYDIKEKAVADAIAVAKKDEKGKGHFLYEWRR